MDRIAVPWYEMRTKGTVFDMGDENELEQDRALPQGHHVSLWLPCGLVLEMAFKDTVFCAMGRDPIVATSRWALRRHTSMTAHDSIVVPDALELFGVLKAHAFEKGKQ